MVLTEERKEYYKKYNQSEKGKERRKKYRESEKGIKYRESDTGKKSKTRGRWKALGLNMENFEEIYKRYTDAIFCDICECVLEGNGRNMKCMDHDHDNGEFRNIVCNYCNLYICK